MSYSEIVVDFCHAIKLTTEIILLAKKRSCSEVLSATTTVKQSIYIVEPPEPHGPAAGPYPLSPGPGHAEVHDDL